MIVLEPTSAHIGGFEREIRPGCSSPTNREDGALVPVRGRLGAAAASRR